MSRNTATIRCAWSAATIKRPTRTAPASSQCETFTARSCSGSAQPIPGFHEAPSCAAVTVSTEDWNGGAGAVEVVTAGGRDVVDVVEVVTAVVDVLDVVVVGSAVVVGRSVVVVVRRVASGEPDPSGSRTAA